MSERGDVMERRERSDGWMIGVNTPTDPPSVSLCFRSIMPAAAVPAKAQKALDPVARNIGALAKEGVNIVSITTSEIRITCLIDKADVRKAVQALHTAFELEKPEGEVRSPLA